MDSCFLPVHELRTNRIRLRHLSNAIKYLIWLQCRSTVRHKPTLCLAARLIKAPIAARLRHGTTSAAKTNRTRDVQVLLVKELQQLDRVVRADDAVSSWLQRLSFCVRTLQHKTAVRIKLARITICSRRFYSSVVSVLVFSFQIS